MAKIRRKTRNVLIVIWCILFVGTVFSLVWTKNIYGGQHTELKEELIADEFFSKWPSYVSDEAILNNVIIPGSHDAGSLNMMPLAETQGHSIADQLRGGVRYFDLRVAKQGDDLVIYHGPINGRPFNNVLNEIKTFIEANPSEFLILDFQHLKNDKYHDKVIEMTVETLGIDKMMKKSVCHSIESTTMADVRNHGYNYAFVWSAAEETADKDYLYARKTFLYSPYNAEVHKTKNINELTAQFDKYLGNNMGSGFYVLQAQRTSYNLLFKRPADLELEFKNDINKYVSSLTGDKLARTNIVMRDFIVSVMENVKIILRLNLTKNLVAADKITEFTQKVA